jgi:hypothetical protein
MLTGRVDGGALVVAASLEGVAALEAFELDAGAFGSPAGDGSQPVRTTVARTIQTKRGNDLTG